MIKESIRLCDVYDNCASLKEGSAVLDCYYSTFTKEIGRKKHTAMVICPGGGYDFCSEREAEPVAFRFIGYGISCFVLRYTCQRAYPLNTLECLAAVRYVRENAERFDIDPDKIIVSGFSAGGHLAACAANLWYTEEMTKALGCSAEDIKVNASMLCYAVLSSEKDITHEGSILNLLRGREDDNELRDFLSMDKQVGWQTPPTFLWHCADDGCVRVENSLYYMTALAKNYIPFESHIYPHGGHGLSLCDETTATWEGSLQPVPAAWCDAAIKWAQRI